MSHKPRKDHKTTTTVSRKTNVDYPASLLQQTAGLQGLPPPGFAHLALQPATKQTTTTTVVTTTISFAPLLIPRPAEPELLTDSERARFPPYQNLPASSSLHQRPHGSHKLDPKVFPLAKARASNVLGDFKLDLGAAQAQFLDNLDMDDDEEAVAEEIGHLLTPTMQRSVSALPNRPSPSVSPQLNNRKGKGRADEGRRTSTHTRKRHSIGSVPSTSQGRNLPSNGEPSQTQDIDEPPRKKSKSDFDKLPFNGSVNSRRASVSSLAFFGSQTQMPSPKASPTPSNASHEAAEDQPENPVSLFVPASPTPTLPDQDLSPRIPGELADIKEEDAEEPSNSHLAATNAESMDINLGSGLELSALLSLPNLVEQFSALPNNLQSHILFQLLRRSSMPVLQLVNTIVTPALKRDFIRDLPLELSVLILSLLDSKSLSRATRVSKKWHCLVDADGRIWKRRLVMEGLWVGDGTEQQEAFQLENHIPRRHDDEIFLERWQSGLWDPDFDQRLAARSVARKLETLRSAAIHSADDVFHARADLADDIKYASPQASAKAAHVTETLRRSKNPNPDAHYTHPYKRIFRRRFVSRRSWTEGEASRINFLGHGNNIVTCLQFNKHRIISASDDNHINVYSMQRGGLIAQLHGHEGGVWALQYIGDMLISGSTDRTVRVWNMKTGRCTHIFLGHVSTVRCLKIMEPQNMNPDKDGPPIWEPPYPLIVTGSRDCTLRVWKLPMPDSDSEFLPEIPSSPDNSHPDVTDNPFHLHLMVGHKHAVRALSGSGRTVVSGSYDCTVRVWDILSGECKHVLRGHAEKVYSVVYDARRQQCASGSIDGSVRLWSTQSGECIRQLNGHASLVGLLGLSTHALVSAAADSTLRVWDPSSGRCKHTLLAHSGAITCFQQDDYKIVSGSDGTLKMWDIRTGAFTRDLLVNLTGVWQVGFDERYCVAAVQRNGQSEYDSVFSLFSGVQILKFQVLDFGAPDGQDENTEASPSASITKSPEVYASLSPTVVRPRLGSSLVILPPNSLTRTTAPQRLNFSSPPPRVAIQQLPFPDSSRIL